MDEDVHILIGLIADEETTVGFLLAGIGEKITSNKNGTNYLMVNEGMSHNDVENFFTFLINQSKVGIILIGADLWKYVLPIYTKMEKNKLPIVIEIPTKSSLIRPIRLN